MALRGPLAAAGLSVARSQGRGRHSQFGLPELRASCLGISWRKLVQVDLSRAYLLKNVRVYSRMLADVESVEVKAEGVQLPQQRIDKRLHQPLPAMRHQARPQQNQIRFKFL